LENKRFIIKNRLWGRTLTDDEWRACWTYQSVRFMSKDLGSNL
jgi:hypothetical protein